MQDSPRSPDPGIAIARHGIVGDMRTVALVADDGTIDFFCQPDLGSPTLFAALLDPEKGGRFRLGAADPAMARRQIYLPDTNILITRFMGEAGIGEVSDFMALDGSGRIVRRATAILGDVDFDLEIAPRPDYARQTPRLERFDGGLAVSWSGGAERVLFHTPAPLAVDAERGAARARIRLRQGESLPVIFCPGDRDHAAPDERYVSTAFRQAHAFWHGWVAAGTYPTRWRDLVVRSALTLKLLTSSRHGSIAAAATFGLPEVVGGERNWDYRYSWVRDAAFTLNGLSRLGYFDEAEAYIHFLMERAVADGTDAGLQIMYGMDGETELREETLDHLSGFRGSRPVRIGNAAYTQRQMDIYGEFLDALHLSTRARGKPSFAVWRRVAGILDWLCGHWHLPDRGIWESRGEPREFLSSRLMAWVALDRGIRIAGTFAMACDGARWARERDAIQESILTNFWNAEIGAFTQARGGRSLDAVVLLMPLVDFINPRDPLWVSTLKAVEAHLVSDCLVRRYRNADENHDGLSGEEGFFTICCFWYVEAVARSGDLPKARLLFEKLHAYANHLGLYSEELSVGGEHLGNFPQGLTHLALVSAAFRLDRALGGAGRAPDPAGSCMIEDPDGQS